MYAEAKQGCCVLWFVFFFFLMCLLSIVAVTGSSFSQDYELHSYSSFVTTVPMLMPNRSEVICAVSNRLHS